MAEERWNSLLASIRGTQPHPALFCASGVMLPTKLRSCSIKKLLHFEKCLLSPIQKAEQL